MKRSKKLPPVKIPNNLTYVAAFLTLRCRFSCPWCINKSGVFKPRKELTGNQWIRGLNRLQIPKKLMVPITLQGGEPSVHPDFLSIINGLKKTFYIDILTNLDFDIDKFMEAIPPERLQRNVPYASIRVSYHPNQGMKYDELLLKVLKLQTFGYDIGVFVVKHPETNIPPLQYKAEKLGIDFRTKEFLGYFENNLYGKYKYPGVMCGELDRVECKNTELLISPNGNIHACHRDLYAGINPLGNILDEKLSINLDWRWCENPECNECDTKIKNNRFQEYGTCSITLRST